MRRYVIAAIAAIGCLLPAACDVAAASTGYHSDWSGQGRQNTGSKPTGANSTGANSTGANSTGAASTSAAASTNDQGVDDPVVDPTAENPGDPAASVTATVDASATVAPTVAPPAGENNGLDVLARDCSQSKLTPHDGFQKAPACVSTAFGEVAAAGNDPTLLITDSPRFVRPNTAFTLKVSTRNLIRDRFLGAAAGGYYLESSVLKDGIQRGHFHTACRMLSSLRTAPAPDPVPAFFVATQDNGGGSTPDTVTVNIDKGLPTRGIAQCAVWAGDGSHRIPMMERANQTPAFDAVRILVG
ncbi:MAG TPA: hypothetical protein VHS35_17620 [Pseudonocardia sp.]|jgi:hypothetical protein|nr:hypothetical protein [Pseudonocardia sp.]